MVKKFIVVLIILLAMLLVSGCVGSNGGNNETDESSEADEETDGTSETGENSGTEEDDREVSKMEIIKYHSRSSQGDVAIDVVWSTPELYTATDNAQLIDEYELDEYLVFDISLTTHSGDLRDYSYQDNVALIIDTVEIKPEKITLLSKDSHHPRVLIKFSKEGSNGQELIASEAAIELVVKDLRNVPERRFTW